MEVAGIGTHKISTMRVKLSTKVAGGHVDLSLINEADNLHIVRGSHELDTLEGTGRDQAGAMAGFGAPCNHLSFLVSDDRVDWIRCPQAEV